MNPTTTQIPVHDFRNPVIPFQLRKISHKNQYDYTQKHRHCYFEVLFFMRGGGKQLIDFVEYEVQSNSCYIVFPNQIHLLKRAPSSCGFLFQFKEEFILSNKLQKLLQEHAWSGNGAMLFENNNVLMEKFIPIKELFLNNQSSGDKYHMDGNAHLLHTMLYSLLSETEIKKETPVTDSEFLDFQHLVDVHFHEQHSVGFYLNTLPIGEKRLSVLVKNHLGTTPLQVIHSRLLLEAKRLLVIGKRSHKEIAYDLGFDSPASFSAFVKKKTGFTASQVQKHITEIHHI